MTEWGGSNDTGALFSIGTDGANFDLITSFTDSTDGGYPFGDVTLIGNAIYGMTSQGGTVNSSASGVLFKYQL
jgi:hypothetical protein